MKSQKIFLWQDHPKRWLSIFILLQIICWTIVAGVIQKNAPLDVMEAMVWGRHWQFGYNKDPYLIAWLTRIGYLAFFKHFTGIYFFSQLSIAVAYLCVWRLARRLGMSEIAALIAVLSLTGIYYYNFTTPEFNDDVLQIPFWALSILFFYESLTQQKRWCWILFGIFAGLALMAKYYSAMLFLPMLILALVTPQGRQSFKHLGIYLAAILFFIIVLPNIIWEIRNGFVYIQYALSRAEVKPHEINHLWYPLKFLIEQLPALMIATILFLFAWTKNRKPEVKGSFNHLFIILMGLGPLLTTMAYAAITGTRMRSMWGTPLFSLFGIMLMAWLAPQISGKSLKRFICLALILFFFSLGLFSLINWGTPYAFGYAKVTLFPGKPAANLLTTAWRERFHQRLAYVAGDREMAARIAIYSKDHPEAFLDWSRASSQWIDVKKLQQAGAIFVWDAKSHRNLPANILKQYPRLEAEHVLKVPYLTQAKIPPAEIGYAFLPPEKLELKNVP